MRALPSKFTLAVPILAAHFAVLIGLNGAMTRYTFSDSTYREVSAIASFIIGGADSWDTVPLPEVAFEAPKVDATAPMLIQFEDPDETDLSGLVGSSSAPRLARIQPTNAAPFALRAGLTPDQVVTVVLIVEVLSDGTVGTVNISRGNGNAAVDAAAIEYVRALRWIPGTAEQRSQSMRISVPVTLSRTSIL